MARPKGSPNVNKKFLLGKLQDMLGKDFNPVMKMAENAVRMQAIADGEVIEVSTEEDKEFTGVDEFVKRKMCVESWEKVAQYVEPKLKAIEIQGDVKHSGGIKITWQK